MKKNMKAKYLIIAALAGLGFSSCGDAFFEQYPSNDITEGNHYQTDTDFNQAVLGCYQRVKSDVDFLLTEIAFRSDENELTAMAVSTQDRYDFDHFQVTAGNGLLSGRWNTWYNGIYRCNDVLDHLAGKKLSNGKKYRGEALFLRSWWYFNLYRVFGGVPIVTGVVSPTAAKSVPRCSEEAMYERLSADLAEAASLLPAAPGDEKGRVTSMAANTLLAKVCLTFGKYAEAKTALDTALANSSYGVMPTTGDAFLAENKMNKEIIFATYFNKSTDNGHGAWYTYPSMADINNPTAAFLALYDGAADNRKILVSSDGFTTLGSVVAMRKWYDTYDKTYTTKVGTDFPHLRYADVQLMYAEAIVLGGGNIADGLVWLNKTRTRAGLAALGVADVPTREAFVKELADERGREFALEGHRWFDLVRLGLAVDYFTALGYQIDQHHLLFPIPQDQLEIVNNNSVLWQNPGY